MPIKRGISNATREISEQWCSVGGVNREIAEQWCGVGGVNRQVYGDTSAPPPTPGQDYTCSFRTSEGYSIAEFRNKRESIYLSSYFNVVNTVISKVEFDFDGAGMQADSPNIEIKIGKIEGELVGGTGKSPYLLVEWKEYKQGNGPTYPQNFIYEFGKDIGNREFNIVFGDNFFIAPLPRIDYLNISVIADKKGAILAEIGNFDITIGTTQLDFYSATIIK